MSVASPALLEVQGLTKHYGGVKALSSVNFTLAAGPDAGRDRPQRRGQVRCWRCCPAARGRRRAACAGAASASTSCPTTGSRAWASAARGRFEAVPPDGAAEPGGGGQCRDRRLRTPRATGDGNAGRLRAAGAPARACRFAGPARPQAPGSGACAGGGATNHAARRGGGWPDGGRGAGDRRPDRARENSAACPSSSSSTCRA